MLIGEVAEQTGISARMLRHYDRLGLVAPRERTAGGYRRYDDADLQRLFRVEGLRSLGLSLSEIAATLADPAFDPVDLVDQLIARSRAQLAVTEELLARLELVRATGPRAWPDVSRAIDLLHGFDAERASDRQRLALSLHDGDPRDLTVLVDALLRETDPNAAGALQWAVIRLGDAAVPLLADALDSPSAERRRQSMHALEKLRTSAADAAILRHLDHDDPQIRVRANIALGRAGDEAAVPALIEAVARGLHDVEAADVLGELASVAQTDDILGAAVHALESADAAGRRRLVAVVGALPGTGAFEVLVALAEDPDLAVAVAARARLAHRR